MTLKEFRISLGISLTTAVNTIGVPRRTYIRYENDENYGDSLKRKMIYESLSNEFLITEDKGVLAIDEIKRIVSSVLSRYRDEISFCFLFGSYAKGYAKDMSDVDLVIDTTLKGLAFVSLIEELRTALNKKVDLLRLSDLKDNIDLVSEIMRDGIKIYG